MYLEVKDIKKKLWKGRQLCTGLKGNHNRLGERKNVCNSGNQRFWKVNFFELYRRLRYLGFRFYQSIDNCETPTR